MEQNIINKLLCLSLNKNWQAIGQRTIKQAIIALNGGDGDTPPALGMDINYAKLPDGSWDFSKPEYINPVKWAEWIDLPIRDFDLTITTAKRVIRVPTVIISTNFSKMPLKTPRVSRASIYERDGGVCQFTGRYVGRAGGNLDHILPRARGGRESFENLVWAAKEVNTMKADRLPHEAGLKLLRQPKAPMGVPISATIRDLKHFTWAPFLTTAP